MPPTLPGLPPSVTNCRDRSRHRGTDQSRATKRHGCLNAGLDLRAVNRTGADLFDRQSWMPLEVADIGKSWKVAAPFPAHGLPHVAGSAVRILWLHLAGAVDWINVNGATEHMPGQAAACIGDDVAARGPALGIDGVLLSARPPTALTPDL